MLTRILGALVVLWLVATLTFLALHIAPGDPTSIMLDGRASLAQIEAVRAHYGLDDSLPQQYLRWLGNCLRADFGSSFTFARPTSAIIRDRLPPTLLLGGAATAVGVAVGLLVALLGPAQSRGARMRAAIGSTAGLLLYAAPPFWLGLLAILLFSATLNWLPFGGMLPTRAAADASLLDPQLWPQVARHLLMPSLVLSVPLAVQLARLLRRGIEDQYQQDHIAVLRAMGQPGHRIRLAALRNALGPSIQVLGLWLPVMVGGAVMVETVFAWPGLGTTAVQALSARDYPLVLAVTLLASTAVVLGNLLADLALAALDPRVRRSTRTVAS